MCEPQLMQLQVDVDVNASIKCNIYVHKVVLKRKLSQSIYMRVPEYNTHEQGKTVNSRNSSNGTNMPKFGSCDVTMALSC